jgi:hypothetical protein
MLQRPCDACQRNLGQRVRRVLHVLGDGNLDAVTRRHRQQQHRNRNGSNNTVFVTSPINPKTKVKFGNGSNNVVKPV